MSWHGSLATGEVLWGDGGTRAHAVEWWEDWRLFIAFKRPRPGYYWIYYIITNSQELQSALAHRLAQTNPVVLMFSANWNEPSKVMNKPFRDMAVAKRRQAIFCQLDVDMFKDIVDQYRVEALPTFVLIKGGEEKARVVGAKVDELNTRINGNI